MEQSIYFELEFDGGKYNGGIRTYNKEADARRYAKRYINSSEEKGLTDHIFVDLYMIDKENYYKKTLIDTIQ